LKFKGKELKVKGIKNFTIKKMKKNYKFSGNGKKL